MRDFQTCSGVTPNPPQIRTNSETSYYCIKNSGAQCPTLRWVFPLNSPQMWKLVTNASKIVMRYFQMCGGVTLNPTTNLETNYSNARFPNLHWGYSQPRHKLLETSCRFPNVLWGYPKPHHKLGKKKLPTNENSSAPLRWVTPNTTTNLEVSA